MSHLLLTDTGGSPYCILCKYSDAAAESFQDQAGLQAFQHTAKAHVRSLAIDNGSPDINAVPSPLASAPVSATEPEPIAPHAGVQLAPVSNQSADARAAIIATIALHGQGLIPFGPGQRQGLMNALSATVTASTNMALTSMELLSISEVVPNNTTSSPSPSRRLLVMRTIPGELCSQLSYVRLAYRCHRQA